MPLAFFLAIPLLLALVALVTGVMGLRLKNTALMSGLYGAASIVGLINLQDVIAVLRISLPATNPGLIGLGLLLENLGYLGIIIAGIVSFARFVKTAKTDPPFVSDEEQ